MSTADPILSSLVPADHALEAEVLGTLLLLSAHPSFQQECLDLLSADCFDHIHHRALFSVLGALGAQGTPMCIEGVHHHFHANPAGLLAIGGIGAFAQLTANSSGMGRNLKGHIRNLRRLAKERRTREIGMELLHPAQLNGRLTVLADELRQPYWQEPEPSCTAEDVMNEAIEAHNRAKALADQGRTFAGLDTGFEMLNDALNGLCPGELTVLGARPSIGKTTLALQMAVNVAKQDKVKVGIVSLEMTRTQMGTRIACIEASLNPEKQRKGLLTDQEAERFVEATKVIARLPMCFYCEDRTIEGIAERIRREKDVALWIVDHLHRIVGGTAERDHERLGGYAHALADLAVTSQKHILLVSQLNRGSEDKADHRPQISDLRGSGSIEEHAVNVLLLHRPGFYTDMREQFKGKGKEAELAALIGVAEIHAEKLRFGLVGMRDLAWDQHTASFKNLAQEYRQEPPPHYTER